MSSWASISRQAKKRTTKTNCVSLPQEKGGQKHRDFIKVPGTRGQGPAGYHTDQIRPKLIQIRPKMWPNQAKVAKNVAEPILAPEKRSRGIRGGDRHGFSRSILSQPPEFQKSGKKVRFLSCLFIKGTRMAISYTPYKRLAPISNSRVIRCYHSCIPVPIQNRYWYRFQMAWG